MDRRPRVAITLREGGQNGGPYTSHERLMQSGLRYKYEFIPLMVPAPPELRRMSGMIRFVRTIRAARPDIVHFAGLQLEGFLVMCALRLAGVRKSVVAVHGSSLEATYFPAHKKAVLRVLEAITLRLTTACYGVSEYVVNWPLITRHTHHPCRRIYNLPHALVADCEGRFVREELGIPAEDAVLISTGRIIRDKGFERLPTVIESLSNHDGVWLLVAGEGDYLPVLRERLARGPLGKRAVCLGFRTDVPRLLAASDVFVLLTEHETFGTSIVEAMAQGVPVVVNAVGGVPEVVTDGRDGFLVDPGEPLAALGPLDMLISSPSLRTEMGQCARRSVEHRFPEAQIVDQMDDLYMDLLSGAYG